MINRIFEALATFSDVVYMVWFIPAFLHVSRLRDIKPYIYAVPALMLAFEYSPIFCCRALIFCIWRDR